MTSRHSAANDQKHKITVPDWKIRVCFLKISLYILAIYQRTYTIGTFSFAM